MFRLSVVTLLLGAFGLAGCQTYRDDLNRAQRYYEDNQFAHALALFRALERDTDSLSAHEQSRYAYFRGMTDYRLARVEGGTDERFDRHARYWLGIATAIEKEHPGGLQEHERKRLDETMAELNAKAFGTSSGFETSGSTAEVVTVPGSSASPSAADPNATGTEPAPPTPAPGAAGAKPCTVSSECPSDHMCQDGACVKL